MNPWQQQSEKETAIADAQSSLGKSDEQRAAMFTDLQETVEAIWKHLSPDEQQRRRQIARLLDPRPTPWWKNIRCELWPADDASSSSP
jgi:hypothetical protein